MALADQVRAVLSDTFNLPADFQDWLIQHQAINAVATAPQAGDAIASGTNTSNVTTSGTTFATGADLLSTALNFTAQGGNSYVVRVFSRGWNVSTTTNVANLSINLDGAESGVFAQLATPVANIAETLAATGLIVEPNAGPHTVNVRLHVNGGSATVVGGNGSGANDVPILVTLERL